VSRVGDVLGRGEASEAFESWVFWFGLRGGRSELKKKVSETKRNSKS
jgi:hypothetical protein